ncbi:hypothetical protein BDL97_17G061900 [Sphagnum fallax]|nr:hypothetical protein BDL97_17G061900 [Sphagnum fallax]
MENAGLTSPNSRRFGMHLSSANVLPAPFSAMLELTGLIRGRSQYYHVEEEEGEEAMTESLDQSLEFGSSRFGGMMDGGGAEVSIRIFGGDEEEPEQWRAVGAVDGDEGMMMASTSSSSPGGGGAISSEQDSIGEEAAETSSSSRTSSPANAAAADHENSAPASSQQYDFQLMATWIEHALPFTILLLMVFIRQHLQGFVVSVWITAVMFKANDLLQKQTALKNERRPIFLLALGFGLVLHIVGVYWWYHPETLWRPLLFLPPHNIPKFWHAVFIIVVNDTVVRQAAMVLKSGLLIHYRNSWGRNSRHQAQLLTLVEYILLLYRVLIPAPVWYRFFLNKEYGNLFSSLTTGLYLTFKLTSTLEKTHTFLAALQALSRREVQYGTYATSEEVLAAGDMCAICQEKMHAPISLCCKHIFCEDCVSEWFERERTCPLCRAVVKLAGVRSYGDGSTNLFIQLF